jgi:hypothetical protein
MDNPEKQNKKHNTLCVGHHYTQDEDIHNKPFRTKNKVRFKYMSQTRVKYIFNYQR